MRRATDAERQKAGEWWRKRRPERGLFTLPGPCNDRFRKADLQETLGNEEAMRLKKKWSGVRDSNSRPSAPKTDALPTALTPDVRAS